jgi:hypothetical protein
MCDLGSEAQHLEDLDGRDGTAKCLRCGSILDLSNIPKLLEHAGAHILHEPCIDPGNTPCGFCLRPASQCPMYLRKSGGSYQIDFKRSQCPLIQQHSRLQYAAASRSSKSSPCSNVPIPCGACASGLAGSGNIVWRYNMKQHLLAKHPNRSLPATLDAICGNLGDEVSMMGAIWKNIATRGKHPTASTLAPSAHRLTVSVAHCTSVALS